MGNCLENYRATIGLFVNNHRVKLIKLMHQTKPKIKFKRISPQLILLISLILYSFTQATDLNVSKEINSYNEIKSFSPNNKTVQVNYEKKCDHCEFVFNISTMFKMHVQSHHDNTYSNQNEIIPVNP